MEHKLYNGEITIKFNEGNHSYWLYDEKLPPKKDGSLRMRRLTGVTTYCGVLDKPALIPWAVDTTVEFIKEHIDLLEEKSGNELLELARIEAARQRDEAAEIGGAIHKWIEQHIKGEQPEMPEDEKVLEGVNNFLDWVEKMKVKFMWSERVVYSKSNDYVGMADIGIKIGNKKYLLDIKTGNSVYEEVKMQTAAYLKALQEETGEHYEGRYVLRISKETEDQYNERMEKKNAQRQQQFIPAPFKIFEAIYLDDNPNSLEDDFSGFLSAKNLHTWRKQACKELYNLKNS